MGVGDEINLVMILNVLLVERMNQIDRLVVIIQRVNVQLLNCLPLGAILDQEDTHS